MPVEIARLTGADRKNPQRFVGREESDDRNNLPPIGDPPEYFMIQKPEPGYARAAALRAVWDECISMWPHVRITDRYVIETICRLKCEERRAAMSGGKLSSGDCSTLAKLQMKMSELARLEQLKAALKEKGDKNGSDPRLAFLRAKGS